MIKKILLTLILTWGAVTTGNVYAQMAADSTGANQVIAGYYTAIGKQSHLYNGPEYDFYNPIIKGNAYVFDIKEFTPGSVKYSGVTYSNVPMLYDINKDVAVILLYNRFTKISLLGTKVDWFKLHNHYFVHVRPDSAGKHNVADGFYDELYGGKNVSVLAKRSKTIQNLTGSSSTESVFSETKDYYLKKGRDYFSFGGKGGLLDLLKDKKKELRQYIKANNIDFRENPEPAMVSIVAYYEKL